MVFNGDIDGIFMVKSSCLQLEKPLQNRFLEWGECFFSRFLKSWDDCNFVKMSFYNMGYVQF